MKTIVKGFGFGLLLQIAIGPLCIYLLQTALVSGFLPAFSGVLAVTLADALFVTLALIGVGKFMSSPRVKKMMKTIGGVIIVIFGFIIFLSALDVQLLPSLSGQTTQSSASVFLTALILTLSSPLTIVFWAGVFGVRMAEEDSSLSETILFGVGAVLSTLVFLTMVSAIAGLFTQVVTTHAIQVINWLAGLILIAFGVKTIFHKN